MPNTVNVACIATDFSPSTNKSYLWQIDMSASAFDVIWTLGGDARLLANGERAIAGAAATRAARLAMQPGESSRDTAAVSQVKADQAERQWPWWLRWYADPGVSESRWQRRRRAAGLNLG